MKILKNSSSIDFTHHKPYMFKFVVNSLKITVQTLQKSETFTFFTRSGKNCIPLFIFSQEIVKKITLI